MHYQTGHHQAQDQVDERLLLLGVDGGGTQCRARLCDSHGTILGEGAAGPANIRLGLDESFAAVRAATTRSLAEAGLLSHEHDIVACLALAGASEPTNLSAAQQYPLPFRRALVTTDAHAACVGAHGGRDGGVVIVGTGTVGWATRGERQHRVGGWGFPISDEGGGAWLGCEAIRRTLWAHDGRIPWTGLLRAVSTEFKADPHAIVRWMSAAATRDYGTFAPFVIEHASRNDTIACDLLRMAAGHIDALVARLGAFGVDRVALSGGLASSIEVWLSEASHALLVAPIADALTGAVELARAEARSAALIS